ncbi:hypothetical protein U1Q18_028808 [Sarracenia purpurea var. burkii]
MACFIIGQRLQEPCKEEFSDWPHGLLAIGTFGNNNSLKEDPGRCNLHGSPSSSQDHQLNYMTPEEVEELQKALTQLLHEQVSAVSSSVDESETHNLQLDNSNFTSSLEDDRRNSDTFCGDSVNESGRVQCSTLEILGRGKDISADRTKNAIGKNSLSYLLKKKFLCRIGLAPTASLRDPIPDKSRMEKILRVILNKKICPQNPSPKGIAKKYVETSQMNNTDCEDEMHDMANDGSKWVKTDSEFIVLEI